MPLPIITNVADFRSNLADYLALVKMGGTVVIKSGKSNKEIGRLEPPKSIGWDKSLYGSWRTLPKDNLREKSAKLEAAYLKKIKKGFIE
jgi:antitoxin (DNA-binding transcriptional repressor) of toxin-antitoxin stability system